MIPHGLPYLLNIFLFIQRTLIVFYKRQVRHNRMKRRELPYNVRPVRRTFQHDIIACLKFKYIFLKQINGRIQHFNAGEGYIGNLQRIGIFIRNPCSIQRCFRIRIPFQFILNDSFCNGSRPRAQIGARRHPVTHRDLTQKIRQ